jgi:nucleotide-binding universal stress UspA family protein
VTEQPDRLRPVDETVIRFERILCPVDFSVHSRHALDHAVAIARRYGGAVTALHVLRPIQFTDAMLADGFVYEPSELERTVAELERFVLDEAGSQPIATKVIEGNPVGAIVREATEQGSDLLVLGTHGHSGFERFMLGSVTERVLRKAPCPVLTVPPQSPDALPITFGHIMAAVDFSPASLKALGYATSLAREAGAQLTAIHVVEPFAAYEPMLGTAGGFANLEEDAVSATRTRLHEVMPSGIAVNELVCLGKPYRTILDQAHRERCDLLAIGIHGRLMDRLGFFGSTANHIAREAECPVLSVGG